jgi:multiple sugar transport system substrate-binding protein
VAKAGLTLPGPSWTMADYEKMAATIFKKTGVQVPVYVGTDPKVGFNDWLRQNNQTFFNVVDGSSLGFADTKLLMEFYNSQLRLLKAGVMTKPDISFGQFTPEEAKLTKGEEWTIDAWSNQVVMTQAPMKRPIYITTLPKIVNSKKPGTYLKPSMFFSVTKTSENKEEAMKFLNFFMNDIEANKVLLAERGIPIVQKVRDSLKTMVDPINKQIFEYIDLVGNKNSSPIDPADPAGAGEVLKAFRTIDQEVLFGTTERKNS